VIVIPIGVLDCITVSFEPQLRPLFGFLALRPFTQSFFSPHLLFCYALNGVLNGSFAERCASYKNTSPKRKMPPMKRNFAT
jgi:hypothetical protein